MSTSRSHNVYLLSCLWGARRKNSPMPVKTRNTTHKRLRILSDAEIEALYGRPHFAPEEQPEYFTLSPTESATLEQFHSIKSRIYCILQLGYFKARQMFFVFRPDDVADDLRYIQAHYFPTAPSPDEPMTKVTRLKQQHVILALCHYRLCTAEDRQHLATRAQQAAMVDTKPIYIFRELLHHLTAQRLVAPGYSFLQDLVSKALRAEQHRLITLIGQQLTPTDTQALQPLLDDTDGHYGITRLKREPKDFSWREMRQEIERSAQLQPLYTLATRLLPQLHLSNESIQYYASLVMYYSVFRLHQLDERLVQVYVLCFVVHRYQRLHDHLLTSLIHYVRRYTDEAKEVAQERVYTAHLEGTAALDKAGQVLKLFTDDRIAADTPFHAVQSQAFQILERPQLDFIADHLVTHARFDETAFQWEHIDTLAPQFKRHLRPLVLAVEFSATSAHAPLLAAIQFLRTALPKGQALSQNPADAFP